MIYWINRHRRNTRCLSWRWRKWRPVRCTWPYWHAAHTKWHCDERTSHYTWYVSERFRPNA